MYSIALFMTEIETGLDALFLNLKHGPEIKLKVPITYAGWRGNVLQSV